MNAKQAKRVQEEWSKIANEQVEIEKINDVVYAFSSELACLRLFKKLGGKARVEYSENLGSWFFALEMGA